MLLHLKWRNRYFHCKAINYLIAKTLKHIWALRLDDAETNQKNGFLKQTSIGFSATSRTRNPLYPEDNVSVLSLTNLVSSHPQNFI
jgi:hypothetical protein